MSAERDVIDLDEYNDQPAEAGGASPDRLMARQKMVLRLVAAFVVGVVLGGVVVSELRDSRQQRERRSSISLVAFPASVGSGGSDGKGVLQVNGQLVVINAGPAPITVRAATAQRHGVLIRDTGQSAPIRPGGTAWIDVKARIECSVEIGDEPLSMQFSVETEGKQVIREVTYPVAIVGTVWDGAPDHLCEQRR
ncbi:hypothetical protein EV384_4660 [Micromonospora kangleipakensis]|uniref:LEA14-like dessication related protein n=1 Tax=Micromonospora kangleipakensis TaxID=1077942 RepID=A0A4Q8BDT7_9ACTN|nr:hypothetical protein [Micromonospora kangleipakensis]RZU76060.1 hypothetical protein EV384_4660 [Micromonospora kangleipakensis]